VFARYRRVVVAARSGAFGLAAVVAATQLGAPTPATADGNDSTGSAAASAYHVTKIFSPTGLKTDQGHPLSKPDDLVRLGDHIFVAFQNGVGSTGSPASNGNGESSLLELTVAGQLVRQWDLTGKVDGLGADPADQSVVATVDEDGSSSLYTVDPDAHDAGITHYCYDHNPLPHGGGTDSIAYYHDKLILSASAPSPSPSNVPAVYSATLEPGVHPSNCPGGTAPATGTAILTNGFADTAPATPADPGAPSTLALTDPDSSIVVPPSASRFGGSYMLDSQGDDQQIYTTDPLGGSDLNLLQLSQSVDDTAFVSTSDGALYATDPTANAVDIVTGPFQVGQALVAATPCNDNNAPSTCPTPPTWPANYLGLLDLTTGQVSTVSTALNPVGTIFVPNHAGQGDREGQ
jgi:hypothetical protein